MRNCALRRPVSPLIHPADPQHLDELLNLFSKEGKRDVERYCRTLVIRSEALTTVLLAGNVAGLGNYAYANHFSDPMPDQVVPTPEENDALGRSGVGKLSGKGLKAARKIGQLFNVRRMVAVHLFYTPSHTHWHMFYFDQRDHAKRNNHWKHGPHVHYTQDTFTRDPLKEVWRKVHLPKPKFPNAVHIRYDYHHNRGGP